MRHSILVAVALLVLTGVRPVPAQSLWQNQIAVTGGPQWAMGPVQDIWKSGTGVAITYYSRVSSHLFVGLRGGYHRFEPRTGPGTQIVGPVHVASKYNLSLRGVQPYLGFDGGLYLLRSETGTPSTEYGVAPKVGFRLPVTTGVDVDLNTTYEVVLQESTNITYVGLNVGIAYIFGR